MSANVQNILLNLEATPPPGAWDNISARLDEEFDAREIKFAEKLYDCEVAPPPGAWAHIALALQEAPATTATPAKIVRLPFRRLAAAAAILAIVGFATWTFLNRAVGSDPGVQQDQASLLPNNVLTPNDNTQVAPTLPAIDASIVMRRRTNINVPRRINGAPVLRADYAQNILPDEGAEEIHYAGMDGLRAENATLRRGIKAPLIKDANGNIILDKSLIISRDNNYIIITGPNGEQTRLSAKFLPLLADLNATTDPAEYFDAVIRESTIWKSRFSEWRYKLMQEASFAPTANNFLDIIALRDLIEEK